jgi:hypothetical protein
MKLTKFLRITGITTILSLLMAAIPALPALASYDIDVTPEEGAIGDEITIIGTDFIFSETSERWVTIFFSPDDAVKGNNIDKEVTTYEIVDDAVEIVEDDNGSFETTFNVPDVLNDGEDDEDVKPGTYYIYVTLTSDTMTETSTYIRAYQEFTVTAGGEISIDPDDGTVGTEVTVSGTDFAASKTITITYGGYEVDIESGSTKTSSSGAFDSVIFIPESTAGSHTITVTAGSSEAEATFTVKPALDVSPTSGEAGTDVTVSGTGFGKSKTATITFPGVSTTAKTSLYGSFGAVFKVPTGLSASTYTVDVQDGTNTATSKFTLTAPATTTPPTTTPPTTTPPTTTPPTTTPPTTTPTTLSISQESGNVGSALMVGGAGFQPNATITIEYDGKAIDTATADAAGVFMSNIFLVPSSKHGDHTITASDGTNTNEVTFTVESVPPPVPQPLLPEMGVKAKSPVSFDWEDATDKSLPVTYTLQIATDEDFSLNSIVLEKSGLTESEYILTEAEEQALQGREKPYYWRIRAIDAASNEGSWTGAGEFYVSGSSNNFPNWALYTLCGIAAVFIFALGYWLGRRTAFYY